MYFTPYRLFSLLQGAVKVLRYLFGPSSWNESFQRLSSCSWFTKESYHGTNILRGNIVHKLNCHGYVYGIAKPLIQKWLNSFNIHRTRFNSTVLLLSALSRSNLHLRVIGFIMATREDRARVGHLLFLESYHHYSRVSWQWHCSPLA